MEGVGKKDCSSILEKAKSSVEEWFSGSWLAEDK